MAHLKSFPITIFLSFLLLKSASSLTIDSGICVNLYNHTNNQTQDTYQINLHNLFSTLTFTAYSSLYHNSTTGAPPDKAYALYLCRGDVNLNLCHSCVANLTDWAQTEGCSDGYAYMEKCMIRYANYSFFGMADNKVLSTDDGMVNATNVMEFSRTLGVMVEGLIVDAAFDSASLFATREASVGMEDGTVYGLAQCTQDTERRNCSGCLKKGYSILHDCCGGKTYGWAMLGSCQLRYDNTSFYTHVVASSGTDSNVKAVVSSAFLWIAMFIISSLFTFV